MQFCFLFSKKSRRRSHRGRRQTHNIFLYSITSSRISVFFLSTPTASCLEMQRKQKARVERSNHASLRKKEASMQRRHVRQAEFDDYSPLRKSHR